MLRGVLAIREYLFSEGVPTAIITVSQDSDKWLFECVGVKIKTNGWVFLKYLYNFDEVLFELSRAHGFTGWFYQKIKFVFDVLKLFALKLAFLDDIFVFLDVWVLEFDLFVLVNDSQMVSFAIFLFYVLGSVFYDDWSFFDYANPVSKFLCLVEVMSRQDYRALHASKTLEDFPHMHSAERVQSWSWLVKD